ncbi:MAG TPA: hypothetical protein PK047_02575 [Saprospiraceae bacterium]|nr:TerB family tellurite resistance protein [Saprospiraceae bacterium]HRO07720.1 hypothetical protein [Saprospiraceae bacterium]HRP41054.1 hypothetical protein [Saprospiraceae bacterium]
MLWDILTEEEKNQILLKLIVHISKADGNMEQAEFAYLVNLCNTLQIDTEYIRTFVHLNDAEINEILPNDEEDRIRILYHALFMMNADNLVDAREEMHVYKLGFKLGFSEVMVREFIELMKHHTLDDLPHESMLNIIRKYNN